MSSLFANAQTAANDGVTTVAVLPAPTIQEFPFQNPAAQIHLAVPHHAILKENIPWSAPVRDSRDRNSNVLGCVREEPIHIPMLDKRVSEQ